MSKRGWLTQSAIPDRVTVAISLPDDENWRSQFLGAILLLTGAENWELFGDLTPEQMAAEWLDIFVKFTEGEASMIPVGTVLEFAGSNLPDGFLWARGQAVSRETYSRLWDEIGPTFGNGNGVDTFNVPWRGGLVGVGLDLDDPDYDTLGNQIGAKEIYLSVAEMPTHTVIQNAHGHTQNTHSHGSTVAYGLLAVKNGTGDNWKEGTGTGHGFTDAANELVSVAPTIINSTPTNQPIGGNEAHENRPPSIVMNYIIKY